MVELNARARNKSNEHDGPIEDNTAALDINWATQTTPSPGRRCTREWNDEQRKKQKRMNKYIRNSL